MAEDVTTIGSIEASSEDRATATRAERLESGEAGALTVSAETSASMRLSRPVPMPPCTEDVSSSSFTDGKPSEGSKECGIDGGRVGMIVSVVVDVVTVAS